MEIKNFLFAIFISLIIGYGCKDTSKNKAINSESVEDQLAEKFNQFLSYPIDSTAFPRNYSPQNQRISKVPSEDWTSGFFPGNLWQFYQLTGNQGFKAKTEKWTSFIEKEKLNDRTHDMGFKIFCSFGNGLKNEYNETIRKS